MVVKRRQQRSREPRVIHRKTGPNSFSPPRCARARCVITTRERERTCGAFPRGKARRGLFSTWVEMWRKRKREKEREERSAPARGHLPVSRLRLDCAPIPSRRPIRNLTVYAYNIGVCVYVYTEVLLTSFLPFLFPPRGM